MNIKSSNEFGNIQLELEKAQYFSGDTVLFLFTINIIINNNLKISGIIYLTINKVFPASQLLLKLKGKEYTYWEAKNAPICNCNQSTHLGALIFYNHCYPLHNWDEECVGLGQYEFPFAFTLKDYLPSSYKLTKSCEDKFSNVEKLMAFIQYNLKVELKSDDTEKVQSLCYNYKIQLKEKTKMNSQPCENSLIISPYCMSCFSQGLITATAKFQERSYYAHQKATLILELNNENSNVNVQTIHCILKKKVRVSSDTGCKKEMEELLKGVVLERVREGTQAKSKQYLIIVFDLLNDTMNFSKENKSLTQTSLDTKIFNKEVLEPTTNGQLISVIYYVQIEFLLSGLCISQTSDFLQIPLIIERENQTNCPVFDCMNWNPKLFHRKAIVFADSYFYQNRSYTLSSNQYPSYKQTFN